MTAQAIEETKDEVISLLDDDDLFLSNKMEMNIKFLRKKEQIRF